VKFHRNFERLETKRFVKNIPRTPLADFSPGATIYGLVLGSTREDTTVIDLGSGALVRWRVPWPEGIQSDLRLFGVVEAVIADDPADDDLAQPEAITIADLPRQIGTYGGRSIRKLLANVVAPSDGPLFGFRGPSAPYWEFRGERPSAALLVCDRGPQLLRRPEDGSTWVRFGFELEDVWLLCEDSHAIRAIDAARRTSLSGKDLALALGFKPAYVLASLSLPLDGHCYKVCTGLLPRY
jgi:hypothetical protein